VMQRWLLEAVETLDLTSVQHVGGDRWLPADSPSAPDAPRERILEVIEWPVCEQARARFAFDQETGRLLRIRVRDMPTGEEVVVDLSELRDIGGVMWPHRMEITAGARKYRDVLSDWELSP